MAAGGIEFGAHTVTHPILSRIDDPEKLRAEIDGAKRRIDGELDRETAHFCYPNGTRADFTSEAIELVRQAGFQSAVTAESGMVAAGADLYTLKRIGVDPAYPGPYFEQCAAGLRV